MWKQVVGVYLVSKATTSHKVVFLAFNQRLLQVSDKIVERRERNRQIEQERVVLVLNDKVMIQLFSGRLIMWKRLEL